MNRATETTTTRPAAKRSARRLTRFCARTSNLALIAAIEAFDVAIATAEPLGKAHNAAEIAGQAAQAAGATKDDLDKMELACDAAERRWMRARGAADRCADALLRTAVDNAADADLKQDVFLASYGIRDMRDLWDEEAKALAWTAAKRDLRTLAKLPPPAPAAPPEEGQREPSPLARAWYAARDVFYRFRAMEEAEETSDDDGRVFDALERWESLPPPSVAALAEVVGASLNFVGVDWSFQDVSDPRTIRDFLDSGDKYQVYTARTYQHLLRLAGASHGALDTPSISGLCVRFDDEPFVGGPAMERAWNAHHADGKLYSPRRAELVAWWRAVLADPASRHSQSVIGSENCAAVWDASRVDEDTLAAAESWMKEPGPSPMGMRA